MLSTGLRVWTDNLLPFSVISFLIYAPALALRAVVSGPSWYLYLVPLQLLLNALIAASLTYGVVRDLEGTRPSLRDCILIGLRRGFSVIGVAALSSLAIFGGMIALVVPGIIVSLMLYVAVPVAIVEQLGVTASLGRSRELTMGHKSTLFGIVVVTWLVIAGITELGKSLLGPDLQIVAILVANALTGSLTAVMAAVAYTDLRHAKDGTQVPELATALVVRVPHDRP
ncbi:hypothetical protein BH11MYX3_BH11MYX3_33540 [soil metagenome]